MMTKEQRLIARKNYRFVLKSNLSEPEITTDSESGDDLFIKNYDEKTEFEKHLI